MPIPFDQKRIILGVTGSAAAYKVVDLASRLHQAGAQVDVILTEEAAQFVSPITFQSVTTRKAYVDADLWNNAGSVAHLELGHAAELIVIAPASANTIASLAHGLADNLLNLTTLSSSCPLVIVPAMDAGLFSHPAIQENVRILKQRGVILIGPTFGRLVYGLMGIGRMVESSEIFSQLRYLLSRSGPLAGRKIIVTAGSTQEPIDPVRYITNRSSGTQGYAIAQSAVDEGADVILITAPTALTAPVGLRKVTVTTASEMEKAVMAEIDDADALVMAAAVADFRPSHPSDQKLKKLTGVPRIDLEPTADILARVALRREETGYPRRVIGFADETEDLLANAQAKLESKNLDLIVANDVSDPESGFDQDTIRVTLLFTDGRSESLPILSKEQVADNLVHKIETWVIE